MARKENCAEYWLEELKESMYRCTGRRDKARITLKAALDTIQSINQSIRLAKPYDLAPSEAVLLSKFSLGEKGKEFSLEWLVNMYPCPQNEICRARGTEQTTPYFKICSL